MIKNTPKNENQQAENNDEEEQMNEFIVSNDGINFRPNGLDEYKLQEDWAHVDQTEKNDLFKCIQGQAVLSNTTASFVASPGSYKVYNDIMDHYGIEKQDKHFLKFQAGEQVEYVKKLVEKNGGQWQLPILAPAGSFILWSSTTVHSGRLPIQREMQIQQIHGKDIVVLFIFVIVLNKILLQKN